MTIDQEKFAKEKKNYRLLLEAKTFLNKNKAFSIFALAVIVFCTFFYLKFSREIKSIRHYSKRSYRFLSLVHPEKSILFRREIIGNKHVKSKGFQTICSRFKGIPFGEASGLVKSVKKIELKEIATPYNASLIEADNGYLLFFRYDIKDRITFDATEFSLRSYIGVANLDGEFNQTMPVTTVNTQSDFSEDPRVVRAGNDLFLSYNDLADNSIYSRTIRLACLDPRNFSVKYSLDLDQHIQPIEKNWIPFAFSEDGKSEQVLFNYSINPHKVLKMNDLKKNEMQHLIFANDVSFQKLAWGNLWGTIRGGTPAKLVDGQYLAFFHSSFNEEDKKWYVMGAYTFDAKPPFRINAISQHPILFKGIYDTLPQNTSHHKLRAIFPAGFALDKVDGREVIHVSCGENDCAVKIITLDKELLLKSLKPIPYKESSLIPDSEKAF
jgi:predicted GH43/DUF377 family glycosyl hydrolase